MSHYFFTQSPIEVNAFLKSGHQLLFTLVKYFSLQFLKIYLYSLLDLLILRKLLPLKTSFSLLKIQEPEGAALETYGG